MPSRARPRTNPTGCACRWDWGEACARCITDPRNPGAFEYAPGALEAGVARMERWAVEARGADQ